MNKDKRTNLHIAKRVKNDEFYTRLEDIEEELKYYKDFFKDKIVYCNCDKFLNGNKSNFFVYFSLMFKTLGLKKLITSYYNPNGRGKVCYYYGEKDGGNMPTDEEIETIELKGDGSFYSDECINLMKECDVVVTNPPFSLFRKFVNTLIENNKYFLIIGNMNAITYKEVFPLIKENKLWLGMSLNGTKCSFIVPEEYEGKNVYIEDGVRFAQINNAMWFTNIDNDKRHKQLNLYKKYDAKKYPKYDNFDAINVDKVNNIPCDYDGIMGVPITFLDKHNPEQFKIIKFRKGDDEKDLIYTSNDGKKVQPYFRILIQKIN